MEKRRMDAPVRAQSEPDCHSGQRRALDGRSAGLCEDVFMKAASAHRRIKVLQLHPAFNVRQHDFADLAEQIFHGLPTEQFETVSAYLRSAERRVGKARGARCT